MVVGPGDFVELYRARNLPEAHAIRLALENAGISAHIDNDLLQGALGDLPMGWATAPRILVDRTEEAAARAILDEVHQQTVKREKQESGEEPILHCLACGTSMDQKEVCPECGWTYESAVEIPALLPARVGTQSLTDFDRTIAESVAMTDRGIWWEVAAVLAVGVVPSFIGALAYFARQGPPLPYSIDAIQGTLLSGCTIFVTLYLIHRSGQSWKQFGITRPRLYDPLLALALVFGTDFLWEMVVNLVARFGFAPDELFGRPGKPIDYGLMVLKFATGALAAELVTRAYLITRLEVLLQSRTKAVLFAAIAFASYHAYQGIPGLVNALLFGMLYGVAYLLLRRIWPLVMGHTLYNIWLELMS